MKKQFNYMLVFLVALSAQVISAQQTTITGKVIDETGFPLPAVNVVEKGTPNGVSSDFDGNFSIDVPDGATLTFSSLGYATQDVSVSGQSVINVTLNEDSQQLDEVIVTSLGITREKKSLGYAATEIQGQSVNTVKESNVASSLAGRVAGVVVTPSSSGAGGGTRVVIRGNNSLSGNNQPLYVIDGVPIDNSALGSDNNTSQFSVADLGDGISDINPDDIASLTVLKGANAAALYGSRASNGAILITTKKGGAGKGLGISLSSSTTFESPLVLPKYQNQFGRGVNGRFSDVVAEDPLTDQVSSVARNGSWGPRFDGSSQLAYNGEFRPYVAQPNNVRDFFETGSTLVNTLALSNSNDVSSVRFSYTNSNIASILPNSSVKRNNFNVRGFTKLGDRLTLDAKVTYFIQDARNRAIQGTEGSMAYLLPLARNVRTEDLRNFQDVDNPIDPANPFGVIAPTANGGNPYWLLQNDFNGDKRKRLLGFAKLDYQVNDWLSAFIRVGTDVINQDVENIVASGHHFFPRGSIRFLKDQKTETNYDFLLSANKLISEKFGFTANLGGNMRHSTAQQSIVNGIDFKIPGRYFLDNTDGAQLTAVQTDLVEKRVNSLYAQASFSYDNMIYLDLNGRNDWSSALAAENRSYFYSSASMSVLLDQVLGLQDTKLDLLKLRGSIAQVGNDTGARQILNNFNIASNGYLGTVQINRPNTRFSESLRPEEVTTTEFGVEFNAFGNRLYGDFSYYDIKSTDLIFDVPVDPGTGFSFFRENVGEINNKGIELLLGGIPIKTDNFEWGISANVSKNENTLISLIEGQELFLFSGNNTNTVDVRAQVGGGYGDIYTTSFLRNDAGQFEVNAEGLPQVDTERTLAGNYQPDYSGGITNTFTYKNFSLNALVDFRIGGEVFSFTDAELDRTGVSERSLEFRDADFVFDGVVRVEGENTPDDDTFVTNTEEITAQEYWGAVSGVGSEYVFDQTNFRLRELSMTYNLPKRLLKGSFIQRASMSAIGRNLFFLYKKTDNFDPESSYSTSNFRQGILFFAVPTTRSLGLSLNLNF